MVAAGQVVECLRNVRKKFHRVIGNGVSKALNGGVQLGSNRIGGEALKAADQGVCKTVQPVAMSHDVFPLDIIQNFAHLLRRVFVMIQK